MRAEVNHVIRQRSDRAARNPVPRRVAARNRRTTRPAPDDGAGRITLLVDRSDVVDGFRSISLDPKEGQRKYGCAIQLSTDREGQVYRLHINGAKIEEKLFVGNLCHFEKFLFHLFVCKVPIEFDEEADDIDTSYPDASD